MLQRKKPRQDSQKSGLAGELFVAAELLKRECQVSLTIGNAKAVDLFVQTAEGKKPITVQVKTLRTSNCYLVGIKDISPDHIYVFVLLHKPDQDVEYFIVSGKELIEKELEVWGSVGDKSNVAGITMGRIRPFKDRWSVFEEFN